MSEQDGESVCLFGGGHRVLVIGNVDCQDIHPG